MSQSPQSHNPWSPEAYAEAAAEDRAAKKKGRSSSHARGAVVVFGIGVLIGLGITAYGIIVSIFAG